MKLIKSLALILIVVGNSFSNKLLAQSNVSKNESNKQAVLQVMSKYKNALESLNVKGTLTLFSDDSQVFESGGVEGSYAHYLEHHLEPELGYFDSFKYSDYKIKVQVDLPYAFTTETYIYTIIIKANPKKDRKSKTISKKGVATSILKKIKGVWKIINTHTSSRNYKAKK